MSIYLLTLLSKKVRPRHGTGGFIVCRVFGVGSWRRLGWLLGWIRWEARSLYENTRLDSSKMLGLDFCLILVLGSLTWIFD